MQCRAGTGVKDPASYIQLEVMFIWKGRSIGIGRQLAVCAMCRFSIAFPSSAPITKFHAILSFPTEGRGETPKLPTVNKTLFF